MPRDYTLGDLILDLLYIPTHISEILNRIYNMKTGKLDEEWIRANIKSYRVLTILNRYKNRKLTLKEAIELAEEIYYILKEEGYIPKSSYTKKK